MIEFHQVLKLFNTPIQSTNKFREFILRKRMKNMKTNMRFVVFFLLSVFFVGLSASVGWAEDLNQVVSSVMPQGSDDDTKKMQPVTSTTVARPLELNYNTGLEYADMTVIKKGTAFIAWDESIQAELSGAYKIGFESGNFDQMPVYACVKGQSGIKVEKAGVVSYKDAKDSKKSITAQLQALLAKSTNKGRILFIPIPNKGKGADFVGGQKGFIVGGSSGVSGEALASLDVAQKILGQALPHTYSQSGSGRDWSGSTNIPKGFEFGQVRGEVLQDVAYFVTFGPVATDETMTDAAYYAISLTQGEQVRKSLDGEPAPQPVVVVPSSTPQTRVEVTLDERKKEFDDQSFFEWLLYDVICAPYNLARSLFSSTPTAEQSKDYAGTVDGLYGNKYPLHYGDLESVAATEEGVLVDFNSPPPTLVLRGVNDANTTYVANRASNDSNGNLVYSFNYGEKLHDIVLPRPTDGNNVVKVGLTHFDQKTPSFQEPGFRIIASLKIDPVQQFQVLDGRFVFKDSFLKELGIRFGNFDDPKAQSVVVSAKTMFKLFDFLSAYANAQVGVTNARTEFRFGSKEEVEALLGRKFSSAELDELYPLLRYIGHHDYADGTSVIEGLEIFAKATFGVMTKTQIGDKTVLVVDLSAMFDYRESTAGSAVGSYFPNDFMTLRGGASLVFDLEDKKCVIVRAGVDVGLTPGIGPNSGPSDAGHHGHGKDENDPGKNLWAFTEINPVVKVSAKYLDNSDRAGRPFVFRMAGVDLSVKDGNKFESRVSAGVDLFGDIRVVAALAAYFGDKNFWGGYATVSKELYPGVTGYVEYSRMSDDNSALMVGLDIKQSKRSPDSIFETRFVIEAGGIGSENKPSYPSAVAPVETDSWKNDRDGQRTSFLDLGSSYSKVVLEMENGFGPSTGKSFKNDENVDIVEEYSLPSGWYGSSQY